VGVAEVISMSPNDTGSVLPAAFCAVFGVPEGVPVPLALKSYSAKATIRAK